MGAATTVIMFFISLMLANRSIKPVAEAFRRQREFISDASHELKTPLAIITSNYDALRANGEETVNSQREWLTYMRSGLDRMETIVCQLLSVSRMDCEETAIRTVKIPFSGIAEKSAAVFEAAAAQKHISAELRISPGIEAVGDPELIRQLMDILWDNTVKYTDAGGKIFASLAMEQQHAVFTLGNSGPGICVADLPYIFDRFYRADRSRASETGGSGLGLAIAKGIAVRIGAGLSATSKEGWTEFRLVL